MIEITPLLFLNENEVQMDFVRSSGPGGQNVNKVASAVQIRFDIRNSPSLPDEVKDRLIKLGGKKVSSEGIIVIDARRYRSQDRNRQDAIARLVSLIRKAMEKPKQRKATRPSQAAKKSRLDEKRKRSEAKKVRRFTPADWD
jgi:ribosome-associated protein